MKDKAVLSHREKYSSIVCDELLRPSFFPKWNLIYWLTNTSWGRVLLRSSYCQELEWEQEQWTQGLGVKTLSACKVNLGLEQILFYVS